MPGMTAYHHCFVRHQTIATTTRQTPMMYSVLPMLDMKSVMLSPVAVRPSWNQRLGLFSHSESSRSGPLRTKPNATIEPEQQDRGHDRAHGEVAQCGAEGGTALVRLPAGEERHQLSWGVWTVPLVGPASSMNSGCSGSSGSCASVGWGGFHPA